MQFLVIAKDYPDVLERRLACRQAHIDLIDRMKIHGHFIHGGALLKETGEMAGSVLVCEFPSLQALQDDWLQHEPYLIHRVWENVEIHPYQVGPSFLSR